MTTTEFREIPLKELHESPLNPRKHFDPKKLEELTASIRANGVRTPLIVRRLGPLETKGCEIGAGHRRYRAAKAAGVEVVPCIVKPMSDAEFLELLNFENLEREDIHPLEEAEGYQTLMQKAQHDVRSIAERVGKSEKYVYDRVKLLALGKEARKLFLEDQITAGHAILLARLSPKDQVRCIGDPKDAYVYGGLLKRESTLWNPDHDDDKPTFKPVSVRELQAWIDEHVKFDRAAADPMLFPETVATVTAAKEVAEEVVQITHDHYVQEEARDEKERIYGPRSWKDARAKACEKVITGVIVVGPGRGEAFKVCVHKECRIHWAAELKERAQRAKLSSSAAATRDNRAEQRRQAEEAKQKVERERWEKAQPALFEAIAAAVKKAPAGARGVLGDVIVARIDVQADDLARGSSAEDLVRYVAFQFLTEDVDDRWRREQFIKSVRRLGVDARKIVAAAAKEKVQTAGKKK